MSDWKSEQLLMCSAAGVLTLAGFSAAAMRAQTREAASSTVRASGCSLRTLFMVWLMIASSSFLLCFMMFLQILTDLPAQAHARPVQRDGHDHLRHAEHLRDLAVVVTFKITEHEHFRGARAES